MGGDLSEVWIVGIVVIGLTVSFLGKTSNEKEQWDTEEDSVENAFENDVPNLAIQLVDLLQSHDVALGSWSVGQSPDSQVVHVAHLGPGMLVCDSIFDKSVCKLWLNKVLGWSQHLSEVPQG